MTKVANELIYEVLKELQQGQAHARDDMQDVKFRLSQLEATQAQHTQNFTHMDRLVKSPDSIDAEEQEQAALLTQQQETWVRLFEKFLAG